MIESETSENKAYSAPIVSKAMKVLRMIAASDKNPGISEIASKLSLAKSTTHGILAALEESGWVLRDPITRKYTCGYAAKNLGRTADIRIPLVFKARPHLEKLARELDEVVFLGICTGAQLLILDQVESSRDLKITAPPGTRLTVFAGAAGKIFLAHMDKECSRNSFILIPYRSSLPKQLLTRINTWRTWHEYVRTVQQRIWASTCLICGPYRFRFFMAKKIANGWLPDFG